MSRRSHPRAVLPSVSDLEVRLRNGRRVPCMERIDLVPERTADGTIVFRAVVRSPLERLRRFLRRLAASS